MIGKSPNVRRFARPRLGFTLFEVLATLSIIVILATIGLIGYQSSEPPGAVNAARNELHGLLRFAREQAIIRGTKSMLIVNYDKTDAEHFLRFAGVIVAEDMDSSNWEAAHSGIFLADGVYFAPQAGVPAVDGFDFDATWPTEAEARSLYECTNSPAELSIGGVEYPVLDTISLDSGESGEADWIGIQFGPDGRIDKADFGACAGGGGYSNKQLVLGVAEYDEGGILNFRRGEQSRAVVLRLNGISYAVDDVTELIP